VEALLTPVINHLLAQHTWAKARLVAHAGKQVELHATGQRLLFAIDMEGYLASGEADHDTDVVIELAPEALKALAEGMDGIMAHVRITGNAELADTLSFVARNLRWDREADLARIFGPIIGRRIHLVARSIEHAIPDTGQRLARNATEYLIHEGALLIAQDEMTSHMADIRRLRDDLARLEQRVERVARKSR